MPAERLSMRQIREVLRLRFASKLPQRAIAKSLGLSQGAVSGYLSRARAAGIVWPLPDSPDDRQLEALLFPLLAIASAATPATRLGLGASRAAPPQCDLGTAVGGVPGRQPRRVRLFLVLRSLPGLGGAAEADDAPDPYRR